MLDTLISRVKEEIGIDGESGSNITTVWSYVESVSKEIAAESKVSITPLVDEKYKAFLWKYLVVEPDLEFYEKKLSNEEESSMVTQPQESATVADTSMEETVTAAPAASELNDKPEESSKPVEEDASSKKRKAPPTKKKPAPKKAKSKPKKKPKPKKKVAVGDSDDDFVADDASSSSESDFDELEESSEESDQEELLSDDDNSKEKNKKVFKSQKDDLRKSNPKLVTAKEKETGKSELQKITNIQSLSYQQVNERYGTRLFIVGSPKLQEEQLYMGIPPGTHLSVNLITVLREIIKTRKKGLYQASVTKTLEIDSRSTGHYCKTLEEKGAIVRSGVSINSMHTNVCIHIRFNAEKTTIDMNTVGDDSEMNEVPYNVNAHGKVYSQKMVLDAFVEIAKASPNHTVIARDVLHALAFDSRRKSVKKWFNRSIDEICVKGYFKKLNVQNRGKGGYFRALEMIREPKGEQANEFSTMAANEHIQFPIKIESTQSVVPIIHMLSDQTLESQCFQVLQTADINGATQKDISFALNMDEHRILGKLMEKMIDEKTKKVGQYSVVRFLEFEGRLKRYRYYTLAAYKKLTENIDVQFEPLPDPEFDESKCYERNIFFDVPHNPQEFNKYLNFIKKSKLDANILSQSFSSPKKKTKATGKPRKNPIQNRPVAASSNTEEPSAVELPNQTPLADNQEPNTTSSVAANTPVSSADEGVSTPAPAKKRGRTAQVSNTTEKEKSAKKPRKATRQTTLKGHTQSDYLLEPTTSSQPKLPNSAEASIAANLSKERTNMAQETQASQVVSDTGKMQMNQTVEAEEAPLRITRGKAKEITCQKENNNEILPGIRYKGKTKKTTTQAKSSAISKRTTGTIPQPEPLIQNESVNETETVVQPDFREQNEQPIENRQTSQIEARTQAEETIQAEENIQSAQAIKPEINALNESIVPQPQNKPARKKTLIDYFTRTPKKNAASSRSISVESATEATPSGVVTVEETSVAVQEALVAIQEVRDNIESSLQTEAIQAEKESTEAMEICEPLLNECIDSSESAVLTSTSEVVAVEETSTNELSAEMPSTESPSTKESFTNESIAQGLPKDLCSQVCRSYFRARPSKPKKVVNGVLQYSHSLSHQLNRYLESRIQVIAAMLESKPIMEVNKDFRTEYLRRAKELNMTTKGTVCNKTLWRTAQEMEARGMAKTNIVACPLLTGATLDRKTIARGDVDLEGEQYQRFVDFLKDSKALNTNAYDAKRFEVIEAPVEPLHTRLGHMQEQLKNLNKDSAKAKALQERITELSKNLDQFSRPARESQHNLWMVIAMEYGWINAIMLRSKVIHELMVRLLEKDIPGVCKEDRTIDSTTLIKNMSITILCQTIGLYSPSQRLIDYISDPDNVDHVFSQIPLDIKQEFFSDQNKFRRRMRSLFQMLMYLGLITPVFRGYVKPEDQKKIVNYAPAYRIERVVNIVDRRIAGSPVRYEKIIDNMDDFESYWRDLQYVCLNHDLSSVEEKDLAPLPADPVELQFLKTVLSPANWSTRSVFSREQRKIINSYVNKAKYTTPLYDLPTLREIAEKAGCQIFTLRSYYQKLQKALDIKSKDAELIRLIPRDKPIRSRKVNAKNRLDTYNGRRVITMNSTRAFRFSRTYFQTTNLPQVDPETAALAEEEKKKFAEKQAKGELLYMDDMQELPVLPTSTALSDLRRTRVKRTVWNTQEDDLLLISSIILRHRKGRFQRFSWAPMGKIFPERSLTTSRHRFAKLMQKPVCREFFELQTQVWDKIYKEGLKTGELSDPDPNDNIDFDLMGFVTYFIQKMSETDTSVEQFVLPASLEDFNTHFQTTRKITGSQRYYEDIFHSRKTMVRRQQALYSQTFSIRKYEEKRYDQSETAIVEESNQANRMMKILKTYALMCLMTPSEVFDPFYCYSVIQKFPKELQDRVLLEMRNEGVLILASNDRPIPGTKFSLSNRFVKSMNGALPEKLFQQAKEYEKFLSQQSGLVRFTSAFTSSGMMACVLNLLSNNKLSLSMANFNDYMQKIQKAESKSRMIDKRFLKFDVNIDLKDNRDQFMPYVPVFDNPEARRMSSSEFDAEFQTLLQSQEDSFSELLTDIIDLLHKQEAGLALHQLRKQVNPIYTDDTMLQAIRILSTNRPALVCRVGFEAVRYVHAIYLRDWTISTKIPPTEVHSAELKEAMEKANQNYDPSKRKELIVPNLWTDINGAVTEIVVKDCKKLLVDIILRKPGITEADIHRHVMSALSRRELQDLLNFLVEQRVLRQIRISLSGSVPKKASIFGKSKMSRILQNNAIEEATQSCFWVTQDAFFCMD